jgi:NAD(P)-dependent dehydrogenase (short-subunit alcohol dehydrogenase family)
MEMVTGPTDGRLAGKTVLITGAGSEGSADSLRGVGDAAALLCSQQGAQVVLADVSTERAENTKALVVESGGQALATVGDVADEQDCQRIVREAVGAYGVIDVLVNNVAVAGPPSILDMDRLEWDRCLAINLTGAMLMSKYVLPHMIKARQGSVVNISSMSALRSMGNGAYSAAKAGMIALTRDVAYSHGRDGIRANSVAPGFIHTPMGYKGDPNVRELHRFAGLLGTEGTAWDVAQAVVFLACDESRWITGITVPVDGGTSAAIVREKWPWAAELGPLLASEHG